MKWNKLISRPMTEEEREAYPEHESIWDGDAPEPDEEVLVSDGKRVWVDIWIEIQDGVGFEYTDLKELWWMSFPEPPKKEVE